jgi:hypothetical protein
MLASIAGQNRSAVEGGMGILAPSRAVEHHFHQMTSNAGLADRILKTDPRDVDEYGHPKSTASNFRSYDS